MSLNYQLAHGSKFELDITSSLNNTGFTIKQLNSATTVKMLSSQSGRSLYELRSM